MACNTLPPSQWSNTTQLRRNIETWCFISVSACILFCTYSARTWLLHSSQCSIVCVLIYYTNESLYTGREKPVSWLSSVNSNLWSIFLPPKWCCSWLHYTTSCCILPLICHWHCIGYLIEFCRSGLVNLPDHLHGIASESTAVVAKWVYKDFSVVSVDMKWWKFLYLFFWQLHLVLYY